MVGPVKSAADRPRSPWRGPRASHSALASDEATRVGRRCGPRGRSAHGRSCSGGFGGDKMSAQGWSLELDAVSAVHDAVQRRVGQGGVAEHDMSLKIGTVASQRRVIDATHRYGRAGDHRRRGSADRLDPGRLRRPAPLDRAEATDLDDAACAARPIVISRRYRYAPCFPWRNTCEQGFPLLERRSMEHRARQLTLPSGRHCRITR